MIIVAGYLSATCESKENLRQRPAAFCVLSSSEFLGDRASSVLLDCCSRNEVDRGTLNEF